MKELDISYRRGLEHNYLIISDNEYYDNYQIQMLVHNRIKGFLRLKVGSSNGRYEYNYEISSMHPISRIFEHRQLSYDNIVRIIRGISDAIRNAREYLLCENGLILIPEYIYADVESLEIAMVHFAPADSFTQDGFKQLSEFILDKVDHQDNQAVMLAYDLFKVVKVDSFVLADIDRLLEATSTHMDVMDNKVNQVEDSLDYTFQDEYTKDEVDNKFLEANTMSPGFSKKKNSIFDFVKRKNKTKSVTESNKEVPVYKDDEKSYSNETAYTTKDESSSVSEEAYGKTVLLSRDELEIEAHNKSGNPRLISSDGKKEYELSNLPVTLGKSKDLVDIVLKDNSVSRMHASIIYEDNRICIKDIGSSNGTYVNSVLVDSLAMPLEDGDEIMVGRMRFTYYE